MHGGRHVARQPGRASVSAGGLRSAAGLRSRRLEPLVDLIALLCFDAREPRDRPPLPPGAMEGPPQLREGPASLWARAHRAGQAVCQRVPPRTSHCHTACTPPCPIIAIIRLRPGRPFPWPTALHNRGLCKLGAGPSGPGTAVGSPRTRTAAAATHSRTSTGDRASSRLTPASGPTDRNDLDPLPKRATELTSSALRAGHRRTVSRARFASAVSCRDAIRRRSGTLLPA